MLLIDWLILPVYDLLGHSQRIACAKRLCKRHKFVDDTSEGPYISFLSVRLRLHDLRTGIKNRPNKRLHHACTLSAPPFCKAKVCQLNVELTIDEYVSWGQIPVNDSLFNMQVSERGAKLDHD